MHATIPWLDVCTARILCSYMSENGPWGPFYHKLLLIAEFLYSGRICGIPGIRISQESHISVNFFSQSTAHCGIPAFPFEVAMPAYGSVLPCTTKEVGYIEADSKRRASSRGIFDPTKHFFALTCRTQQKI